MMQSELNYIAICLCNKDQGFIFLLSRLVVYSWPTAMSVITGNNTLDLFYLLKRNFKNLLFDSLFMQRSFENLQLFVVTKMEIPKNTLKRIMRHSIRPCLHKYRGFVSQYMLRSVSLWQPLTNSMLKNKRIFSLVVLKNCTTWSRQQSYKLKHCQRIIREA